MRINKSPDDYAETATRQAALARDLADRTMSGAPMEKHERGFIAAILKDWADTLPLKQKRPAGQAPKFCHGTAARMYAIYRAEEMSDGDAMNKIADIFDVTTAAIKKSVDANRAEVDELIAAWIT